MPFQSRELAFGLGLMKYGKETVAKFVRMMASLYRMRPRRGLLAARGQPAGRAQERRRRRARREGELRRQRRVPPSRAGPSCRTRTRKTRSSWRPRRPGSTTCPSTETSGASSTAPGFAMATMDIIKHAGEKARRRARELPRRRRWRHAGAGHEGVQHDLEEPEGEGDLRQHLRRDHASATSSPAASSLRRRSSA